MRQYLQNEEREYYDLFTNSSDDFQRGVTYLFLKSILGDSCKSDLISVLDGISENSWRRALENDSYSQNIDRGFMFLERVVSALIGVDKVPEGLGPLSKYAADQCPLVSRHMTRHSQAQLVKEVITKGIDNLVDIPVLTESIDKLIEKESIEYKIDIINKAESILNNLSSMIEVEKFVCFDLVGEDLLETISAFSSWSIGNTILLETKNISDIDRTKSVFGPALYTSSEYPMPIGSKGTYDLPCLQIELEMINDKCDYDFEEGLLQVWAYDYYPHEIMTRVIPKEKINHSDLVDIDKIAELCKSHAYSDLDQIVGIGDPILKTSPLYDSALFSTLEYMSGRDDSVDLIEECKDLLVFLDDKLKNSEITQLIEAYDILKENNISRNNYIRCPNHNSKPAGLFSMFFSDEIIYDNEIEVVNTYDSKGENTFVAIAQHVGG